MWKVTGSRVLVEVIKNENDVTEAGLELVRKRTLNSETGKVVDIGPGSLSTSGERFPPRLQIGDVVMFNKALGEKLTQNGVECKLVNESEILAVIS